MHRWLSLAAVAAMSLLGARDGVAQCLLPVEECACSPSAGDWNLLADLRCGGDSEDCGCSSACGAAGGCDAACEAGLLGCWDTAGPRFGLIAASDHRFDDFISPMTNPVFFEDPRTLTEVRMIYLRHAVPLTALGGEIHLWAAQLRAAITDRLSIIATKDGYATSTNPLIDDGFADVSLGVKYTLLANPEEQRLLTAGLTYELPVGSARTQQGNGDGLFNLFLSAGTQIGCRSHWVTGSGFLLPADPADESSIWFWSNHFDHRIGQTNLYVLFEFNWYYYLDGGDAFTLAPIEGGDLFNFGTVGVAGNSVVTGAFGFKYKPCGNLELGVAWENPLSRRKDVLDNRLTVDCILRW